ncbi:unnamed protein product [Owenia fusiformis]|uniref:Sodium-coupled monocarboxylate transporter 1 n=1 Tax=Owenia fusiformis TaxID=6347 RepID=A0A8S4PAB3_OWEFU|nr:unnamed protein product [Owenia fusiformis]
MSGFGAADYVVFVLVLLISASIGIVYAFIGGKQKTTQEYLLANRQMQVLPVALSLLASFMSAITLLGTPSEVYTYGTQYMIIGLSYFLVIPGAAHIYIPIFYNLGLTSAYEYLELRFSKGVRLAGSMTFSLQMILYMSVVLYAPSLALNAVTGINVWASVISVGSVCIFYTTLGGMKAVMWTDVFQVCMMFAGLFAVLIRGTIEEGGWSRVWEIAQQGERIEFFNFDPNPGVRHTFWSLAIGGYFTWVAIYGINQAMVQRAISTPTLRTAQIALWINLPGLLGLMIICSLCGLLIYSRFQDCHPIGREIMAADQLLPLYVMKISTWLPGLPGLFVACLFSGALSTVSSGLNSLSAVALTDLIRAYWFKDMTEARATLVGKIVVITYGLVMIALTFVASQLGGVLQAALALFGMIGGPLLGLFSLGMFFPWANWKGAYAGLFTGLFLSFWIGIGAQVDKPVIPKLPVSTTGCPVLNATSLSTNMSVLATASDDFIESTGPKISDLYTLSYMWYSGNAVITVVVVGIIVSLITGRTDPSTVDPRLIFSVGDKLFWFLPETMKHKLRFGVPKLEPNDINDMKKIDQPSANGAENEALFGSETQSGLPNHKTSQDNVSHISASSSHSLQLETSM